MFDANQRQIFEYHNGVRKVKGDPLTIHRKLILAAKTEGHDLEELIKVVAQPVEVGKKKKKSEIELENVQVTHYFQSVDILLGLIRGAFNVKPVEEDGLTESETLILFNDFICYFAELKKNTETSANSSPSTDIPQWDKPPVLPMNVS
jgi:hypothetical protein